MENFLTSSRNRTLLLLGVIGLILIAGGIFYAGLNTGGTKVEVLPARNASQSDANGNTEITAEISGEVINPGVYKLMNGSRIDDLLVIAGGITGKADRVWMDKYLNRATKVTDGQKVYIPSLNQQSNDLSANKSDGVKTDQSVLGVIGSHPVNINTASLTDLDSLPGIGPVYGQSIIEHRPYSSVEELLSKGALKTSVYNKVKDLVSVY